MFLADGLLVDGNLLAVVVQSHQLGVAFAIDGACLAEDFLCHRRLVAIEDAHLVEFVDHPDDVLVNATDAAGKGEHGFRDEDGLYAFRVFVFVKKGFLCRCCLGGKGYEEKEYVLFHVFFFVNLHQYTLRTSF